ncbi:FHA domain-containing protein [Chondromyces apiculatus]|uniref:FHA domain-containing protein n=1 Tax=Chondromyces apiculatus DSM 436 TaxID=1192034 RepID=A0A017TFF9_9BACT|nr:FHA domain-containing protein [Chondromyces apiculatus]EYF07356.1 Hypothetical protein CAP_0109 [Chondromyces apiculatus DSM 436]
MGLFERFGWGRGDGRRKAEAKELAGDLAAAVDLYIDAELHDEAARVLLLRADAEQAPERRLAFCAAAARTATSPDMVKGALRRKALMTFDLLVGRGVSAMRSEVLAVAQELEHSGEPERAADAYAMAGDQESEARALAAAGAIEKLEERLRVSLTEARSVRERAEVLSRISDLDRVAERRTALAEAERWLAAHVDERVADAARAIRARLLRGPIVDLEVQGTTRRYALGDEVTLGRGDATIVIASRAISRIHARLRRGPEGAIEIEDLGTRNGTTIAGARLSGPLRIGGEVQVLLGGEVPCRLTPLQEGGCEVELAGTRVVAPLQDLAVGPWRLRCERVGPLCLVVLTTPPGADRPYLQGYQLAAAVELGTGDAIASARGGEVVFRVPGGASPTGVEAGQDRFP